MRILFALAGAGLLLSACATSSLRETKSEKVGGGYFLTAWQGDGPNDPTAKPITINDWRNLLYLQEVCQRDMANQRPNALLEVGHDTAIGIASNAVGVGVGAKLAFGAAVNAMDYAKYGAGAGGGSGVFAGVLGRGHANRYDYGQCMYAQVSMAQQYKGDLVGKRVIINSHSIDGRPIPRPTLTQEQVDAQADARLASLPPERRIAPPRGPQPEADQAPVLP